MPPNLGTLPTELTLPPDVIAAKLRDLLEQSVAQVPDFLVVNRADLDTVLREQRFGQSPLVNQELAPKAGRLIPAQIVLMTTVDRVDIRQTSRRETSNEAADLTREADRLTADVQQWRRTSASLGTGVQETRRRRDSAQSKRDQMMSIMLASQVGSQAWVFASTQGIAASGEVDRCNKELRQLEPQLLEAERNILATEEKIRDLRERATYAETHVAASTTIQASMALVWRALDTSFGVVAGSGTVVADASIVQRDTSVDSRAYSNATSTSVDYETLLNGAITKVAAKLATDMDERLEKIPLRAKIAKVEPRGVVLNCGREQGLSVGDTFGVRQKRELLTDPDTGLPLEAPGAPAGKIRVAEVFDRAAFAQVLERTATLKRGDEVEWLGRFLTPEELERESSSPALASQGSERAPVGQGELQLVVTPWAGVVIDGIERGTTPLRPIALAAGTHKVELRHPEYGVVHREVRVQPNEMARLEVDVRGGAALAGTEQQDSRKGSDAAQPATRTDMSAALAPEAGALYADAYAKFARGDFDLAIQDFLEYLEHYPSAHLSDNAQYWIGECLYGKQLYEDAVATWDELLRQFPESDKIADAHYKKGMALEKMGRGSEALLEYRYVVEHYPDSEAGRKARQQVTER